MIDPVTLTLSAEDCLALLAPGGLGRVAVSVAALPAILPVHFALVDRDVVVRAPLGGTLARAMAGRVVAFEVDGSEPTTRSGWSVLVVGHATATEDEKITREAAERGLDEWRLAEPVVHVRLPTTHISGRAFGARAPMSSQHCRAVRARSDAWGRR